MSWMIVFYLLEMVAGGGQGGKKEFMIPLTHCWLMTTPHIWSSLLARIRRLHSLFSLYKAWEYTVRGSWGFEVRLRTFPLDWYSFGRSTMWRSSNDCCTNETKARRNAMPG